MAVLRPHSTDPRKDISKEDLEILTRSHACLLTTECAMEHFTDMAADSIVVVGELTRTGGSPTPACCIASMACMRSTYLLGKGVIHASRLNRELQRNVRSASLSRRETLCLSLIPTPLNEKISEEAKKILRATTTRDQMVFTVRRVLLQFLSIHSIIPLFFSEKGEDFSSILQSYLISAGTAVLGTVTSTALIDSAVELMTEGR